MSAAPPFEDRYFIADTSAWSKARQLEPDSDFSEAVQAGQIGTCAPVKLEILAGTRNAAEFVEWQESFDALRDYPIARTVWASALTALRELSELGAGLQRGISPVDAVIAATAADYGVGVLHYDGDFDKLERVLNFESRWLRPRGTLN